MSVVQSVGERPEELGHARSPWDGTAIAWQLVRDGVVASISAETVRRIRGSHRLQPLVSTLRCVEVALVVLRSAGSTSPSEVGR